MSTQEPKLPYYSGDLPGLGGRLRSQLLPAGGKQERLLSPVSFFLKFGIGPVLRIFRDIPESGSVWPEI